MHACACFICLLYIYIWYVYIYIIWDIAVRYCTHIQKRCAYAYISHLHTHGQETSAQFSFIFSIAFLPHWGEWLQENPALWESWLPNETACTSGKGLVNVSLGSSLGVAPGASRIGTGWRFMATGTFRDETARQSQVEVCSFCMVVVWQITLWMGRLLHSNMTIHLLKLTR